MLSPFVRQRQGVLCKWRGGSHSIAPRFKGMGLQSFESPDGEGPQFRSKNPLPGAGYLVPVRCLKIAPA